jgi:hypothetical protein
MKSFLNYIAEGYRQYEEKYKISINEADSSKYIVEKNPHDKLWYVMGHVGRNKWMPVSSGFKDKGKAQKWARSQSKVDSAAKGEVSGV